MNETQIRIDDEDFKDEVVSHICEHLEAMNGIDVTDYMIDCIHISENGIILDINTEGGLVE